MKEKAWDIAGAEVERRSESLWTSPDEGSTEGAGGCSRNQLSIKPPFRGTSVRQSLKPGDGIKIAIIRSESNLMEKGVQVIDDLSDCCIAVREDDGCKETSGRKASQDIDRQKDRS